MKKISGLLILLVMTLLATSLFAENNFNELFNEIGLTNFLAETKIDLQEVSLFNKNDISNIPLSFLMYPENEISYLYNNSLIANIGFEMGNMVISCNIKGFPNCKNISELKGDYLHFASLG